MNVELVVKCGADVEVIGHYNKSLSLLEYAKTRVIANIDDIKLATDDLSIIAGLKKAMEAKKKEYLAPFKSEIEVIRATFEHFMDPVLRADQITKDKILAYDAEQSRIRAEQEDINAKKMELAQKEMELNGELSESVNLVEVNPVTPTTVRTNMGTVGMKANWKYRVFDPLAVPREYLVIDNAMLNTIAKTHHDSKQVPGVEFYNDPIIAVRAKVNKVELEG